MELVVVIALGAPRAVDGLYSGGARSYMLQVTAQNLLC